jgi:Fic-DOC domain mobile mystery protein B
MIPQELPGNTPIDPAEIEDLIPSSISTQAELNEFEQASILEAEKWLLAAKPGNILSSAFLKELHRRMFNQTWKWAGHYRKTEKNIGTSWPKISLELETLCREAKYWVQEQSYGSDELAIRFHHKLVLIHCFPNGNGRHARLAADCLVESLGMKAFTWGACGLRRAGAGREKYLECLKAADKNELQPLIEFARS